MAGDWSRPFLISFLITVIIGMVGAAMAYALKVPAPFLIGPMVVTSLAAVAGLKPSMPPRLVNVAFVIVGMLLGSNVSEDTLSLVGQWPWSMGGLAVILFATVALSTLMMRTLFKLDPTTAYLSSVPGHLSMVMSMATSGVGDAQRIVVIQSVRLLFLTLFVPVAAMVLGLVPDAATLPKQPDMDVWTLGVLAVGCAGAGLLFTRLRVPAPMVIGAMLVAVTAKLAGLYHGVVPMPIATIGLLLIGIQIGVRMSKVTLEGLKRDLWAGLAMTVIMIGTTALGAFLIGLVIPMDVGQIWMGLAPGGLETISALGLALGYDTAFIAAHQTWRLLILGVAIPVGPALISRLTPPGSATDRH